MKQLMMFIGELQGNRDLLQRRQREVADYKLVSFGSFGPRYGRAPVSSSLNIVLGSDDWDAYGCVELALETGLALTQLVDNYNHIQFRHTDPEIKSEASRLAQYIRLADILSLPHKDAVGKRYQYTGCIPGGPSEVNPIIKMSQVFDRFLDQISIRGVASYTAPVSVAEALGVENLDNPWMQCAESILDEERDNEGGRLWVIGGLEKQGLISDPQGKSKSMFLSIAPQETVVVDFNKPHDPVVCQLAPDETLFGKYPSMCYEHSPGRMVLKEIG